MNNEDILQIENLKYSSNTYVIRWNMTKLCNYYCDFCIQGNKDKHIKDSIGESKEVRHEIALKLVKFIEEKLNNKYSNLHIYLIGGEVTILSDFRDIFKMLLNVKFEGDMEFHITTNLSCKMEFLKNLKSDFLSVKSKYSRKLSISASYYKEFSDEEEFIKKARILHSNSAIRYYLISKKNKLKKNKIIYKYLNHLSKNPIIIISISYPLVEDKDYDLYRAFKRKYSKYVNAINYIIVRNYKKSISNDLKDKLSNSNRKRIKLTTKTGKVYYFSSTSKIGLLINKTKHFTPKGFLCDSGVNSISINSHGLVSRCPSCSDLTIIGSILKDDIDILKTKISCPSLSCSCDYYHVIESRKKDETKN